MTIWRPPAQLRVKVIGPVFQSDHLLAFDVLNDAGGLDGVRPLGGTIEFGELREAALRREFREELMAEIDILGDWTVFENLFTHEGHTGHEILFAAPIRLLDRSIALGEDVVFLEADGTGCRARWHPIDALARGVPTLYPDGLSSVLRYIYDGITS